MSKTAILSVRIISDSKEAAKGFSQAAGGVDKLEGKVKGAASAMSVASAGVIAFGKEALDAASALQQSTGAVESVFKSQADAIKGLAADAAQSVGLSANQYQEFASVMGSQLKNLGVEQSNLVPTTDKLITMGADLASMYGGTTADAVEALSAVFRGETDPIEKYGISIKQSDVNARLAADGLDGLEGEARKQAETQARLAILTEQSADAQGNFAREVDTAAGSAQIAAAEWENAKASLGEALLPIATRAAEVMADLAAKMAENPAVVARVAGAILGLTAALWAGWAAIKVWKAASAIATGVSIAWQVMTGRMVLGNASAAASAGVAASSSAAAWIGAGLRAAGAWSLMAARAVGSFVMTVASAVASAASTAAAWIGAGLRAAGAWSLMAARAVGSFVMTVASAVASAASTAAAWIGAGLRAAGAWSLMAARAVASFVMTAAGAAASAAATAAAWVASTARTIAAFIAQNAVMLASRGAILAMAAGQAVLNAVMAANPITLVVAAVAALIAVLVLAYNRSETFRNAVQAAGNVGKAAFQGIANFVRNLISTIGNLISRAGGIGGVFRSAMSVAAGAVDILMSPIRGLISLIESVIGAISRIRFPSPPAWLSKVMGSAAYSYGDVMGVPNSMFRFMAQPQLTAAAQPELTAARSPSLDEFAGGLGRLGGNSRVEVDNSITINVDGSGIVDERRVADSIRRALTNDNRNRGRVTAGGATWL